MTEDLHGLCDISFTYEDQYLQNENEELIIRTWILINWCTGQNQTNQQNIKVLCTANDIVGNVNNIDGVLINDVTVILSGDAEAIQLSEDGTFSFETLPLEQNYTLSASKNDDDLNGVSTYDLVLMSRHILATEIIEDPYKMIAADVNEDGNITTLDIILLRQLILNSITELPSGRSWRFFDANQTFDNPLNPFTTPFLEEVIIENFSMEQTPVNFIGVKIGDVG